MCSCLSTPLDCELYKGRGHVGGVRLCIAEPGSGYIGEPSPSPWAPGVLALPVLCGVMGEVLLVLWASVALSVDGGSRLRPFLSFDIPWSWHSPS